MALDQNTLLQLLTQLQGGESPPIRPSSGLQDPSLSGLALGEQGMGLGGGGSLLGGGGGGRGGGSGGPSLDLLSLLLVAAQPQSFAEGSAGGGLGGLGGGDIGGAVGGSVVGGPSGGGTLGQLSPPSFGAGGQLLPSGTGGTLPPSPSVGGGTLPPPPGGGPPDLVPPPGPGGFPPGPPSFPGSVPGPGGGGSGIGFGPILKALGGAGGVGSILKLLFPSDIGGATTATPPPSSFVGPPDLPPIGGEPPVTTGGTGTVASPPPEVPPVGPPDLPPIGGGPPGVGPPSVGPPDLPPLGGGPPTVEPPFVGPPDLPPIGGGPPPPLPGGVEPSPGAVEVPPAFWEIFGLNPLQSLPALGTIGSGLGSLIGGQTSGSKALGGGRSLLGLATLLDPEPVSKLFLGALGTVLGLIGGGRSNDFTAAQTAAALHQTGALARQGGPPEQLALQRALDRSLFQQIGQFDDATGPAPFGALPTLTPSGAPLSPKTGQRIIDLLQNSQGALSPLDIVAFQQGMRPDDNLTLLRAIEDQRRLRRFAGLPTLAMPPPSIESAIPPPPGSNPLLEAEFRRVGLLPPTQLHLPNPLGVDPNAFASA